MTLVDHATLSGPLLELQNVEVVGIIDHHQPVPAAPDDGCFIVESVGSCATLVAERLLAKESYEMPRSVATLLLGAVLLDTVGLDREAGRLTRKDEVMAERLGRLSDLRSTDLYKTLSAARHSICGLSTHQLLVRDLKCVSIGGHELGFSSVTCLLSRELLDRGDTEEAVLALCESRGLSALVVLGVSVGEASVTREIAIFQPEGSDMADAVATVLESDTELECERVQSSSCILLHQRNPRLSRKHILPLVADFLSSLYALV